MSVGGVTGIAEQIEYAQRFPVRVVWHATCVGRRRATAEMASPTCGFGDSDESLGGMNSYPAATRTHKLNVQVIHVKPLSSSFGDYVGGQKGTTVSTACSVFF